MYSERKQIAKGVYITNISADKFKSNYIQIRFVMPRFRRSENGFAVGEPVELVE